jgi:hypothetical protein
MGREKRPERQAGGILLSSEEYFRDAVEDALAQRQVRTFPLAQGYLIDLLRHYLDAANLFDEVGEDGKRSRPTLAETFLRAASAEPRARAELLKRLADRALYISGFFGDSLQRKLVDLDYYADMGGSAYATLADCAREDSAARIYREFAERFSEFVEVLSHISSRASVQSEENIMRLYETYEMTGSALAREKLLEKGLIAAPRRGTAKKQ